MNWALVLFGSYFLGAVPFGVLIARMKGVDITKVGSGNIGATNVQRALGKKLGLLVFLLDLLKGFLPAIVGHLLFGTKEAAGLAGVCAVAGHCLSPFLGFKGGKGISTGLGVLLGTSPLVGLSTFVIFAILTKLTGYVSLGSMLTSVALIPLGFAFGDPQAVIVAYGVFALFVIYRHRANVERLRAGTEPKFTWVKDKTSSEPAEPSNLVATETKPG